MRVLLATLAIGLGMSSCAIQPPTHVIVETQGQVDVWTQEHIEVKRNIIYITATDDNR
jgi:hypothetical protein